MLSSIFGILTTGFLVAFIAAPLWANPVAPTWQLINSSAPARYNHKCAYDTNRGKVVLFGGMDSTETMSNDVWEFSGSEGWNQIQATGPDGRVGHGLCYDTSAHLTILFGGENQSGQYLNDTWSWNGTNWTKLDSTGPSPRGYFTMSYDCQRQRIVLFGGADPNTDYGDTWEWDGSQWLLRSTSGPTPRVMVAMAFDDRYDYPLQNPNGHSILFGGQAAFDDTAMNDTWSWDGNTWSQLITDAAPSPRVGHSMAFCGLFTRGVIQFGGQNASFPSMVFNTTMQYDPNDTTWLETYTVNEPPARSLANMIEYNGKILLIGGENGAIIYNDVWLYPSFLHSYAPGDVNNRDGFTGLDVVYAVNYMKGGPPPPFHAECPPGSGHDWYVSGDVNGSCTFTGLDVTYMVAYLKGQHDVLMPCAYCPPGR